MYAMIKLTKTNGREYIVINTDIQAGGAQAPMQIQINIVGVSEEDKTKLYQMSQFNQRYFMRSGDIIQLNYEAILF